MSHTTCGECYYLNWKEPSKWNSRTYYCRERDNYFEPNDWSCNYFKEDKSQTKNNDGCYITTIVNKILGYDDNGYVLNILRFFRENYLKNIKEGKLILYEYDTIGPIISQKILKDSKKTYISKVLLGEFLNPTVYYIENNCYNDAIEIYKKMVTYLCNRYSLQIPQINLCDIPKNDKNLGKGRILKTIKA